MYSLINVNYLHCHINWSRPASILSRADKLFWLISLQWTLLIAFFDELIQKNNIFRVKKIGKWSETSEISMPESNYIIWFINNKKNYQLVLQNYCEWSCRFTDSWQKWPCHVMVSTMVYILYLQCLYFVSINLSHSYSFIK